MMTMIENVPAHAIAAGRAAIAALYARLARAAARAGQAAPVAPTLRVSAVKRIAACNVCHDRADAREFNPCANMCPGVIVGRDVVDVEIVNERPVLAGWEFLAVVETMDGGNLIRRVPGSVAADGELDAYRSGDASRCDHCATARRRLETFVVRSSDGALKLVGRNCLADFTGASAETILASLTVEKIVRELGDGEGSGGGGETDYDVGEFLAWAASAVRRDGFVSRATESMLGTISTASVVLKFLTAPSRDGAAKWIAARREAAPTDADRATAVAVLTWARELAGTSDYEQNLRLVATQKCIERRHAGLLASAVTAWERETGAKIRAAREAANRAPSAHIGAIGEKLKLVITVEKVADVETQFGISHFHTMRDAAGNAILWRTGTRRLPTGWTGEIRGTVKKLAEFRGEMQTELTRCAGAFPEAQ